MKLRPIRSKKLTKLKPSVQAILLLSIFALRAESAQVIPCSDILYLVEQSKIGFPAISEDAGNEPGISDTARIFLGAQHCEILEDPEKKSYKCTWEYDIGAEQASMAFRQYAKEVGDCLGSRATQQLDQSVNHPDTYSAYLYRLSSSEIRVTFKNKGELLKTFVSIVTEGSQVVRR